MPSQSPTAAQRRQDRTPASRAALGRSGGGALAAGLAGAAIGFGAAALYAHYRSHRAVHENPAAGRFIEVDGVRLHYLERGTGDPVVLLHGNWMLIEDFTTSGLIDRLAQKHRVIAFDRPGFGHSARPRSRPWTPAQQAHLLTKAFAMIGIEQPTIVGHSWGTLVAVALGLNHPRVVKSLVLLSGYYYPSVRGDVPLQAPLGVPIIGDLLRFTLAPLATRASWPALLRKLFRPNPVPAHFERFPAWMVCRPSQLRAIGEEAGLMIPSAAQFSRRYAELAMPVFIMAGSADQLVDTADQSQRLHGAVPGSVLRIVPEVGHMIHHVAQEQVTELIAEAAGRGRGAIAYGRAMAS